jgi:hypothetical protein
VPSIQMYSALYAIGGFLSSAFGVWVGRKPPEPSAQGVEDTLAVGHCPSFS